MSVKDKDKKLVSYVSFITLLRLLYLHFVDNQNVLLRNSRKNNLFYFIVQIEDYSCRHVHYQSRFQIHRYFLFFYYLGFLSRTFTNHRTAVEGGEHFFDSSLPLPSASQTLRHQLGDYCRKLTSAHSQQPDSNREPLVSERKLLITKLRAL